ncbi:MAG TPA: nucleotidyltransferase family protein [Myxococcota bacterium]|nr:nucleotidyltransferase family protein [Myxococcota bacterium]
MDAGLRATAGLGRSLMVKRQRGILDAIGARVGTKVVYLKAAWADPVLYSGLGERWGVDIDVLVEPRAFDAFAAELRAHGFRGDRLLAHHALRGLPFRAPADLIDVDLHRALGPRPWFPLDDERLLERAHAWDSVDGPIMGLCAEDQVVHAVVHYAGARFTLDDRHLGDVLRLLARQAVDWQAVIRTCADAHLTIALHVLADMLRRRGGKVPEIPLATAERLRVDLLRRLFNLGGERRVWTTGHVANIRVELLALLPLLSTRTSALPRFLASAVAARLRKTSSTSVDAVL